ncbi:MAG: glycosyltransferase family 2 protein, partial [Clostridiales bacterium]|nr:glycosyltransferase family 2 protein [Candidatus Blautia equi]
DSMQVCCEAARSEKDCCGNAESGEKYARKDSRIRYMDLKENLGIAENTNAALKMATGDFIGLLDHDDLLAPNALYEVAKALAADPEADTLYTDEDKVTMDLDEHFQPHLKPDFNLDLLRTNNYICHFFVVRRSIVDKVGGFRREFDGAQDYDFIFRCVEQSLKVAHVPEILYHWRTHKASTADNPASKMYAFEAGKRAIEAHLQRTGVQGEVSHTMDLGFYRVKYPVTGDPLVSIIIPNKDQADTLKACLDSIREKTTYKNIEILIVENNSTGEEIFRYYKQLSKEPDIRLLRWKREFNYSAINNSAAAKAKGEYLLFLNNDITVITPDWIQEMLGVCMRKEVGAVGAKLIYPDNTIQHAGCVIGMGDIAGAMFVGMPAERSGYLHKASILQDMSAVTAACLLMKKSVFDEVGGFEEKLAVAFNDMDLCLKVRETGALIVYDPYAQLYHYDSNSRGAEDSSEKIRRFQSEIEYMRTRWISILKDGDPYYNKNLSLTKWNYSLRPLPGMKTGKE